MVQPITPPDATPPTTVSLGCPACGSGELGVIHRMLLAPERPVWLLRCTSCNAAFELEQLS